MDPTWVATGLKVELETLVSDFSDYESLLIITSIATSDDWKKQ